MDMCGFVAVLLQLFWRNFSIKKLRALEDIFVIFTRNFSNLIRSKQKWKQEHVSANCESAACFFFRILMARFGALFIKSV